MLCVCVFFLSLLPLLFSFLLRPCRCHEHNEETQRTFVLEMTFVIFTIICTHFVFDMKIRVFGFCVHWNRYDRSHIHIHYGRTGDSFFRLQVNWKLAANFVKWHLRTILAGTHRWQRIGSEVSTCWKNIISQAHNLSLIHALTFSKAQRWHQNEWNVFNKLLLVFANNNHNNDDDDEHHRHHL